MGKAGEEIWVQFTAVLIDWEGKPGVLCFLRDLTKERNLEARFMQDQKMEAVGRLAGGIAHDFNNLLTVTIGYCDLALARIGALDPLRHDLEKIRKVSNRCAALTRQILDFSRKQILVPKVINLGDVVADMDKMLRRLIGEDIDLVSVRGKDLWNVKADLGLSTVYGIVKQSGGHINVYSEPGKGTTFKVYFPAIEAQPDAVPTMIPLC